jgi:dTDP-4-amino-4,6-dideoxygalactose transaminase
VTDFQTVPLLDLKAQYQTIRAEVQEAIEQVIESQNFILGPEVKALEQEIAAYSQCAYGIGVSSGTDALLAALMAIGLNPGDEVITTSYSFFSTASSIMRLGGKPVFIDIDPKTYNIDPSNIPSAITPRTRAIIPVHLFGQMADMDPIIEIAEHYHLYVIEDAAQAIGAEYNGKRAGSIGNMGCLSFFPSKNLGAFGDAGMVITNDQALADYVALIRNHGHRPKYYNKVVGGNFRMDAIQAAVLRVKLKYLDIWTSARQRNAQIYRNLFEQFGMLDGTISSPYDVGYGRHIYHQFVIRTQDRNALMAYLKASEIGSAIYYPVPLHLQECFFNLGYHLGDLPQSELAALENLALPIYPELTTEMQRFIVNTIDQFFSKEKNSQI